jgi:hypothetical protein
MNDLWIYLVKRCSGCSHCTGMVRLVSVVYQANRNPHKLVTARLRHPILFGNRVFAISNSS